MDITTAIWYHDHCADIQRMSEPHSQEGRLLEFYCDHCLHMMTYEEAKEAKKCPKCKYDFFIKNL